MMWCVFVGVELPLADWLQLNRLIIERLVCAPAAEICALILSKSLNVQLGKKPPQDLHHTGC